MRMLPFALVALSLTACARPDPLGPQPTARHVGPRLSADQVRTEMVGNTGHGDRTGTTTVFAMYVAPDGSLVTQTVGERKLGRWRISDNGEFCSIGAAATQPGEVCQSVHKEGDGVTLVSPHSVEQLVFAPGDKL
jgi:hypothetical protein